jgi:pimeloyl-ACP methyl ester carboxylesterase
MPYAKNGDVNIYYEEHGKGRPLVFAHAACGNLEGWKNAGYLEALEEDYRLILFDARGHGKSDKPDTVDKYQPELMMNDVLAVMEATGTKQTHYFGYSMGCMVGFRLALYYPDYFHSFVLAGITPYDFPETAVKALNGIMAMRKLQLSDPDAYLQRFQGNDANPLTEAQKNALLLTDPKAIIAALEAILSWSPLTNEDLSRISKPCLVYCGEQDEGGFHEATRDCVNHMPNARYISFPGLGHVQAQFRLDKVLPSLKAFWENVE